MIRLSARRLAPVVALVAALAPQAASALPPLVQDGRPASGEELRRLRKALVVVVDANVKGPLLGNACWGSPRRCRTFEFPEIVSFRDKEYAESWFLIDGKPKSVDFERELQKGAWRARAGGGFRPPLPCPVLRAFERRCP